jgi:hypothetical protein
MNYLTARGRAGLRHRTLASCKNEAIVRQCPETGTRTKRAVLDCFPFLGGDHRCAWPARSQQPPRVPRECRQCAQTAKRTAAGRDGSSRCHRQSFYALEEIQAPTLVIDAADVVTFPGAKYTAEHIPRARFIPYETGGHVLLGHEVETRAAITDLLRQRRVPVGGR